jgi:hypothetical protein
VRHELGYELGYDARPGRFSHHINELARTGYPRNCAPCPRPGIDPATNRRRTIKWRTYRRRPDGLGPVQTPGTPCPMGGCNCKVLVIAGEISALPNMGFDNGGVCLLGRTGPPPVPRGSGGRSAWPVALRFDSPNEATFSRKCCAAFGALRQSRRFSHDLARRLCCAIANPS